MTTVFLHLVDMSMTAGYLIVAVVILRLLLQKAPKWIRGILWAMVGLRLVMPFSFESVLSLIPTSTFGSDMIESAASFGGNEMLNFDADSLGTQIPDFDVTAGAHLQSETFSGIELATEAVEKAPDIAMILSIVWLAGLSAMLIYCGISYIRLSKRVSDAVIFRDGRYAVYQSEKVDSPFVLGIFNPRIYIPTHMEVQDVECVIAHEKAHIVRKDHWIKPLGFLLLSIYWFHPLVWLAYILLSRDIELACDEKVIRQMGVESKKAYSEALLKCSIKQRMVSACPLAFGEVGVKKRIMNVLNYKKPAFWIIIVSVVLCVVVAVCFMTNPKNKTVPHINDETAEWENVSEITIYADGYYGRTLDAPLIVTDETLIKDLVEATLKTNQYREVEEGKALEGLAGIYIDYGNHIVISMYEDVNYGMIGDLRSSSKGKYYYLPEELYQLVIDTLEENALSEETSQSEEIQIGTLTSPPTMTLQDSLSSAYTLYPYHSGTYSWNYAGENGDETVSAEASGAHPAVEVKGQTWLELTDYNNMDYGVYMMSFPVQPDYISIKSYDLLDLGNIDAEVLSETVLDSSLVELELRRIYEVTAEWEQEHFEERGFYGTAYYAFAVDWDYKDSEEEAQTDVILEYIRARMREAERYEQGIKVLQLQVEAMEEEQEMLEEEQLLLEQQQKLEQAEVLEKEIEDIQTQMADAKAEMETHRETLETIQTELQAVMEEANLVCIQAHVKDKMVDTTDRICVSSDTDEFPGAFEMIVPEEVYDKDALSGGENILIIMEATRQTATSGNMPVYEAWYISPEMNQTTSEQGGNTMAGIQLPLAIRKSDLEVNTLRDVSLNMWKYKSWEGDMILENNSGRDLVFGDGFEIQRKVDGDWYELAPIQDIAFHQVAYDLPAGETVTKPVKWDYIYGELPSGQYRIVQQVMDYRAPAEQETEYYYLASEFELLESE